MESTGEKIKGLEKEFDSKFWQEFEMNERHLIWDFFEKRILTLIQESKYETVRELVKTLESHYKEQTDIEEINELREEFNAGVEMCVKSLYTYLKQERGKE
jgi:hypothetical protein